MDHGDFTRLAADYSRYRPGYSEEALAAILDLLPRPVAELDFADVGAGTGIWTRMVAARGPRSAVAVEPNDAMRAHGIADSEGCGIEWRAGCGEDTGLATDGADLVTTASCFHWMDFEPTAAEIRRVLRPGGRFAALWNPRLLEESPLLVEIEEALTRFAPGIRRISSGRSAFCEALAARLDRTPGFDDVRYLEGRHTVKLDRDHYLGVWNSVNDVRVQAGEERFARFLEWVAERIADLDAIEATYLTRVWAARVR